MTTYWIYQVLGWFAYSAIGIAINLLHGGNFRSLIVTHAFLVPYSIGVTHIFRREIRRRRPSHQPISRMWPFLAAGVSLISLSQTALVVLTNIVVAPSSIRDWTLTVLIALWWGMFLATGVWTMLYIRFAERRGHEAREGQLQLALREALESQINPHFLFNCLNSIRALVLIDPPRAQYMLTRLADVLRHSLQHTGKILSGWPRRSTQWPDYLALETIRFEERLRAEFAIDPAVAEYAIPPMILQTLVENAIKHGIGQVTGSGDLVVRAERQGGFIRLVVENTVQLTDSPATPTQLGLTNTRERLLSLPRTITTSPPASRLARSSSSMRVAWTSSR
jgi:two-component system LytT family sensor kinase